jgi:hypothetical protein
MSCSHGESFSVEKLRDDYSCLASPDRNVAVILIIRKLKSVSEISVFNIASLLSMEEIMSMTALEIED